MIEEELSEGFVGFERAAEEEQAAVAEEERAAQEEAAIREDERVFMALNCSPMERTWPIETVQHFYFSLSHLLHSMHLFNWQFKVADLA